MATDPDVRRAVVESLAGLHGRARTEMVQRLAVSYATSPATINGWARQAGQRVRQVRRDRGTSRVSAEELKRVAATVAATKRLDGDLILPVCDAIELLRETGHLTAAVSRSTFYRQLRAHALLPRDLRRPTPFRYRSTPHPNAEWQLDVSNCVQYFLDAQGLGEREIALELHKNHPAEFRQIKRELLRYAVVDHASGQFWFRYYYAAGESAHDTLDFFCEAMQPKAHDAYRFHGVPVRLFVDRGSLARAKMSRDFLALMEIELGTHLPGNPRAKGLVEWLHKFLLRFEARLKFQRPRDLEELNRWAFEFCVKVCCTRVYRAKWDARGLTRLQRWLTITPEQLRLPHPTPVLRRALRAGFQQRRVDGGGRFTYEGRPYHLPDSNAWKDWVWVHFNPYEFPAVVATWKAEDGAVRAQWRCQPLTVREDGWLADTTAPGTTRRPAATVTQQATPELERIASETFGVTWKGTGDKRYAQAPPLGAHKVEVFGRDAEAAEGLGTMPTPGTPHAMQNPEADRRLSLMQLLGELAEHLGRPLTAAENARVRQTWPEGVAVAEIETVLQTFTGGTHTLRPQMIEAGGSTKVGMEGGDEGAVSAAG